MTTNRGGVSKDSEPKGQFEDLPEPFRSALKEIDDKAKMATENIRIVENVRQKSLPQILDEMDGNIYAASEASRKAEVAARIAKLAADAASKASLEAEMRAEEARRAGEKAAETATRSARAAAAKAEEVAELARLAAEESARKSDEADKSAQKAVEEFKKAAEGAAKRAEAAIKAAEKVAVQIQQETRNTRNTEALLLQRIELLEKKLETFENAKLKENVPSRSIEERRNLDGLLALSARTDPVLAEIWDNDEDTAYDDL